MSGLGDITAKSTKLAGFVNLIPLLTLLSKLLNNILKDISVIQGKLWVTDVFQTLRGFCKKKYFIHTNLCEYLAILLLF